MGQTVLFDRTAAQGRLELSDRDCLDLLNRMSSNDLTNLAPGAGRPTVLTTALARIIDHVIVYNRGEYALMITGLPEIVRQWLGRHIFWQDRVKLRDVSAEWGQLELYGEGAAAIAEALAPGAAALAPHHFVEAPFGGESVIVARTFPLGGEGYLLLAPAAAIEPLRQAILTHDGLRQGDERLYEILRIEAGLPGSGHELTEEYIPLEAGLWESVSFTKGCYIGQEIIARMESRHRLAKTLVPLRLAGMLPVGAKLMAGGAAVGTLTSVAQRDDGTVIGLGFVRPEQAAPGTRLEAVAEGERAPTAAEVTTAPLLKARRESQ